MAYVECSECTKELTIVNLVVPESCPNCGSTYFRCTNCWNKYYREEIDPASGICFYCHEDEDKGYHKDKDDYD